MPEEFKEPTWDDMDLGELHSYVAQLQQEILASVSREARWVQLATVFRPLYSSILSNHPLIASQHVDTLAQALFSLSLAPYYPEALAIAAHTPTLKLMLTTIRLSPPAQQRALEIVQGDMDVVAGKIADIRWRRTTFERWITRAEPVLAFKMAQMLSRQRRKERKETAPESAIERWGAERGFPPLPGRRRRIPTEQQTLIDLIIRRQRHR